MVLAPAITSHDIERELVSRDFLFFLERVHIVEPPPGGGIIPFEIWPHIGEVVKLLNDKRLLVILKARQVGISWLLAAYALWTALYHDGAVVLELSQSESVAAVLLDKCRQIHSLLPAHLQEVVGNDSTREITFPDRRSKLVALPSTERAGRSETATLVFQDEADFHDYLEPNYTAIKPTIDAGGQLVMASTVNKQRASSLFRELYMGAPANGYHAEFIGWAARPGRDQAWLDKVRAAVPETASMSPELYMEQEYPTTAEEALSPSRALAAFDTDTLTQMLAEDVREPFDKIGEINIYQRFSPGKKYSAGTDTSHGTGADDAVTVVLDVVTGMVVADIKSSTLAPELLAQFSVDMLAMYKNPIWAIEDNDWGIVTIRKAQEIGYDHLFQRKSDIYGWHTNEATRYQMWGELISGVNERLFVIPSKAGLGQFITVIRNPDKNGRIEGMAGTHDDYPTAVAIAWQMRKYAWGQGQNAEIQKF